MRFIDFFAGVGGFRRGFELSGHRCVGFCEWNKYAAASYTSMHLINDDQRQNLEKMTLKQRQKEILKDDYRNGEWFADDIMGVDAGSLPDADCWTFGAPCQDFSIAGKRKGLGGSRSVLVREIFRLLEEQKEQDRPEWIIYENVKGMLSSNRGLDYLSILSEMDRLGYDIQWQNMHTEWYLPQHRERIYTIGHLRRYGAAEIFPITGTDGENSIQRIKINQCGIRTGIAMAVIDKKQNGRMIKDDGDPMFTITGKNRYGVALDPIGGIYPFNSKDFGHKMMEKCAKTLKAEKHDSSIVLKISEATKKGYDIAENGDSINLSVPGSKTRRGRVGHGVAQTLDTKCSQGTIVGIMADDPEDLKDGQGLYVKLSNGSVFYCLYYEKCKCYITIRRLTPRECFRLQGWTDEYFDRAAFVNSDSQLYMQAGNGVSIPVVKAIGDKIAEFERK